MSSEAVRVDPVRALALRMAVEIGAAYPKPPGGDLSSRANAVVTIAEKFERFLRDEGQRR